MRFVDTNVLIYAVSTAPEESEKTERALTLLDETDLVFSIQVLQEFYVQSTRSGRTGVLTHSEAVLFTTSLTRFRVQDLTLPVMYKAFEYRDALGLSYWDCAILAAAQVSGCSVVLSEDLSYTQDYDGLRVVNPFLS